MSNPTNETLAKIKEAQQQPNAELAKAWTQSSSATTGLTAYDLEAPAKLLYPVITPLRNAIPRVSGKGGIQANWKAITGINTGNISAGVSEGNRGGVVATSQADYLAAYRGIGLEDYVTFEADYAAEGFDDAKARAVQGLLRALMIQEEKIILGGNTSVLLGTTPTPTLSTVTTGGTMAAITWSVICIALTLQGYLASTVVGGVVSSAVRTNADGSSDTVGGGAARKSAAATQVTTGTTSTLSMSVAAVSGAVAYAWFWGAGGSELLGAITTINSNIATAAAVGTQNASVHEASDASLNALVFDGLLYQAFKSGSNAYLKQMATGTVGTGTPLTAGADGTITEFDVALQSFWDNYRLSPSTIWVSAQEMNNIRKKVLTGAAAAAQRFVFDVSQGELKGGSLVKAYLNPFTMEGAKEIPIKIHPNMPAGTVFFDTDEIPYPLSNVSNVKQIRTRRDYYQIEWPIKTRKYEYGVYADEVLQNYFPPAFGVITNIANG